MPNPDGELLEDPVFSLNTFSELSDACAMIEGVNRVVPEVDDRVLLSDGDPVSGANVEELSTAGK